MAISEDAPLSPDEATICREQAKKVLSSLQETIDPKSSSWVRDDDQLSSWLPSRSKDAKYFDTHGFLVVPKFASEQVIHDLKEQMKSLVQEHWHPFDEEEKEIETFGTDAKANEARGDYFLDSSNRVHYFAEPKANLDKVEKTDVNETERKISILNKAGHGMHNIPGAFQDYTLSDKMRNLVLDLGWKDPVVPQSMYIFKQAKIGGTVHSHQDSTFLYTTPRQTCLGLWLALDDATLENGCLWARPGSHKEPLRRQFHRNPEYFQQLELSNQKPKDIPQLKFRQHHENPKVDWDGGLPTTSLLEEGFIPIEVKAGDLVTFCGTLDHLSLPNFSSLPRHTFQLHLVEGPKEGITWSPENWLQYPEEDRFIRLFNYEYQGELESIAGFPVTQKLPSTYKRSYTIDLNSKYPGQDITVQLYKEFVRVKINGQEMAFGNSVGLMGDYKTGKTLARDGVTVLDDFTELGDEWQVLPSDPTLFHEASKPQFPELCIKPEDPRGERQRRLAESEITVEQAEAVCASLKDALAIKDCVYDISATQDLDMVGAF